MKTKKNIVFKTKIVDKNNQNQNHPIFYRLILAGDSGVGKTQIINVFNRKVFQKDHIPTFGIDFQIKTLNIIGKKTNIYCIDTAGSEDFSQNTGKLFIKKANAFIIIYDITSKESFNNLYKYYNIFKFALNDLEEKYSKKILYLIGNKYDLKINRIVNENEARDLANKYDAKYMEVSAKNGLNIDRLFEYIIQDIIKREEGSSSDSGGNVKNNAIYRNIMSIRSNDSLRNTNRLFTENESRQNFETSSYFLKTRNHLNANNDYINNINNYQENKNKEEYKKSFYYYQNENKQKKCIIF
jgi:small GTP-binding protein